MPQTCCLQRLHTCSPSFYQSGLSRNMDMTLGAAAEGFSIEVSWHMLWRPQRAAGGHWGHPEVLLAEEAPLGLKAEIGSLRGKDWRERFTALALTPLRRGSRWPRLEPRELRPSVCGAGAQSSAEQHRVPACRRLCGTGCDRHRNPVRNGRLEPVLSRRGSQTRSVRN